MEMLNGAPDASRRMGEKPQLAEITRRVERSGENKAMAAVEQAARALAEKVAGDKRVGSVHDAVVSQMRKCVGGAETKSRSSLLRWKRLRSSSVSP